MHADVSDCVDLLDDATQSGEASAGSTVPPCSASQSQPAVIHPTGEPSNDSMSKCTQRSKRGRSVGRDPPSPESLIAISEITKKQRQLSSKKNIPLCNDRSGFNIPGKFCESCVFCNKDGSNNNMLQCAECDHFYHLACCSVPQGLHSVAINITNLLGWTCQACRSENKKKLSTLLDEILALKTQVANLVEINQNKLHVTNSIDFPALSGAAVGSARGALSSAPPGGSSVPLSSSMPIQYADVVKVVGKTVRDVNRRRRNVIISGLAERETMVKDMECVADLASELLNLDIGTSILTCKRIGKQLQNRPRRLLVTLISESAADELLHRAPLIRERGSELVANSVYINRDLTPEEANEAFQRRQQRRVQRGAGDMNEGTPGDARSEAPDPSQRDKHHTKVFYNYSKGGSSRRGSTTDARSTDLPLSNRFSALDVESTDSTNPSGLTDAPSSEHSASSVSAPLPKASINPSNPPLRETVNTPSGSGESTTAEGSIKPSLGSSNNLPPEGRPTPTVM